MNSKLPADEPYFHGRITRQEAEAILGRAGSRDGMFLLREDMSVFDQFTLSLVENGSFHHYQIERKENGEVMIAQGRRFPGPVELIEFYASNREGLITMPRYAVCRPPNKAPMIFRGITAAQMELELEEKARKMNLKAKQKENALGLQRQQFMIMVARELHQKQPWFHHSITRGEAENRLHDKDDGTFLVRKKEDQKFALSLQHQGITKHYIIDLRGSDMYAIEQGPSFDSIMQMIDHYYNKSDGLLCRLVAPCVRPGMQIPRDYFSISSEFTVVDYFNKGRQNDFPTRKPPPLPPESDEAAVAKPQTLPRRPPVLPPGAAAAGPPPVENGACASTYSADEENQKIYDSLPISEATFNLKRDHLHLLDKLGKGCFGSVMKGVYIQDGRNIQVAVKTIKKGSSVNESAMMKEAKMMSKLKHRHIVRMIGLCQAEELMLVLELATLGPLHRYLKHHPEVAVPKIIDLVYQVARGMQYLEAQNFIHRDLAARNVLLVNEEFAKISDFGMSKALGLDANYYMEAQPGKWPIKWYAPECMYYHKFDSKSDVWSFGVTAWEALSYGKKPYPNLKGQQVLQHIMDGNRLEKPEECPRGMYDIMLCCWLEDKHQRPNFSELVEKIRKFKS